MMFLLDTTAFSDLMRKHPGMDSQLRGIASTDQVVVCTVVRGEIRYGIERPPQSKRRQELEIKASNLFDVIPCYPVPEAAADYYAKIKVTCQ
jgi:predicted nucleic acid-binding protein